MKPGKFEALLRGIIGGRLFVERLEGTFKLSQNKGDADRLGAAKGLGASDRGADARNPNDAPARRPTSAR
jgi:predicted FMN-binding regulatory protein PaiB